MGIRISEDQETRVKDTSSTERFIELIGFIGFVEFIGLLG